MPVPAPRDERWATPLALLLFVLVAAVAFGASLAYPLTDADDLILLSWVSKAASPLGAVVGDWGLGNAGYRPLHTASLWLSYRTFGVTAVLHQAINLSLHVLCVWLLYVLVRRIQPDRALAWLFAAMALVSLNTASAATWVSDRPTLFVATAVVTWLLVGGWTPGAGAAATRHSVAWLTALSILALLGKESGVILPGLAVLWALAGDAPAASRRRVVATAVAIVAAYVAMRWWMFGARATTDLEGGYRFGVIPYAAWMDLSLPQQAVAAAENMGRGLVAPWLPLFTFDGQWVSAGGLARTSVVWLPTCALLIAATRRPLSAAQRTGMALIGLDAVVHCTLFRYRMFYLSQVGICLFLAGASWSRLGALRRPAIVTIAALAVLANTVSAARGGRANLAERQARLRADVFDQLVIDWGGRIDKGLTDRVLRESAK